jgi:aspartate kinase
VKASRNKLLVVKYGGSVLEDGSSIRGAAEAVKEELDRGNRIVVVVSAIKGVTDQLLSAAAAISHDTPLDVIDHIIGLGEEQSVRLMASALKSLGVDAVEVTPYSPGWPIVTDGAHGDAEPILEECRVNAELGLRPLIDRGRVPVVCGFVGRSLAGDITTLGRGGSDTTGVILARCLGADELVLVKDVCGIYTADPKAVEGARPIEALIAWEANVLTSTGARVLHGKLFRYKPDGLKIRIVSKEQKLGGEGTLISGTIPELEVESHEVKVVKVTILGDVLSKPEALTAIYKAVKARGGSILSLKATGRSTTIIVDGPPAEVLRGLHDLVDETGIVKAISGTEDLALIRVRGRSMDDTPRAICEIQDALSQKGVNVRGLTAGQSSVELLVDWGSRGEASEILEERLRRKRDG